MIARRARLLANPRRPQGEPTAPRPATPQREARKDADYQARQASWSRQQDASKAQGAQTACTTQVQKVPVESPAPEW